MDAMQNIRPGLRLAVNSNCAFHGERGSVIGTQQGWVELMLPTANPVLFRPWELRPLTALERFTEWMGGSYEP